MYGLRVQLNEVERRGVRVCRALAVGKTGLRLPLLRPEIRGDTGRYGEIRGDTGRCSASTASHPLGSGGGGGGGGGTPRRDRVEIAAPMLERSARERPATLLASASSAAAAAAASAAAATAAASSASAWASASAISKSACSPAFSSEAAIAAASAAASVSGSEPGGCPKRAAKKGPSAPILSHRSWGAGLVGYCRQERPRRCRPPRRRTPEGATPSPARRRRAAEKAAAARPLGPETVSDVFSHLPQISPDLP